MTAKVLDAGSSPASRETNHRRNRNGHINSLSEIHS